MYKLTIAEALACLGLTAALFFSSGPASRLLDPEFRQELSSKASACSLAYQVLGYHAPAPEFPIKHEPLPLEAEPAKRAGSRAKAIGREVWRTVSSPFARARREAEAR